MGILPRRLSLIKKRLAFSNSGLGHRWKEPARVELSQGMPIMAVSPSPSPDPLLQCKDRRTKLFTAAAFPDQTEILLENTSMFKNMPLNVLVSGASVRSNFRG